MAEINLLQTNQNKGYSVEPTSILNKIGIVILVLVVLVYLSFLIGNGSLQRSTQKHIQNTATLQDQIKAQKQYPQLVSYQNKLHNTKLLLDKHLKWSMILDKFAIATLKTARFNKFIANADGTATINGFVPDFASLDKQIKAYQLNDFQYIRDVRLINVALSSELNNGIDFTLKVVFNTQLLKNTASAVNIPSQ